VLDEIRHWLLLSGFSVLSLAAVEPDLPRWERFLREREVSRIPSLRSADPHDAYATNLLCVLATQARPIRDSAREHELRNLTRLRPWKA
jgi:hypothetical protein